MGDVLRLHQFLTIFLLGCVLTACVGPGPRILDSRYLPLHPVAGAAVTFSVDAEDLGRNSGIRQARLYVYEYEQFVSPGGIQSARQRPGGLWGLVETWDAPPGTSAPTTLVRTMSVDGFPDGTYVRFIIEVEDVDGKEAQQHWAFDAGASAFGTNAPILLLSSGYNPEPGRRFDIAFVADAMDYGNARDMLSDLSPLIYDGYQKSNVVLRGQKYWAFWYSNTRGNSGGNCGTGIPSIVDGNSLFDHKALIHSTAFRDCKRGSTFSTEPFNIGTALHETGHAALDLADEYSDGHQYDSSNPHHNVYSREEDCEAYNRSVGRLPADCHKFEEGDTIDWYSPETTSPECIMRQDGDAALPDFKHAGLRRASWFYQALRGPTP